MVFQDFDFIQERRRQEIQRALKKKIIIAVAILVIGGDNNNSGDSKPKEQPRPSTPSTPQTPPENSEPTAKPSGKGKGGARKPSHAPAPSPKPLSVPLPALPVAPLAAPQGLETSFCEGSTYKTLCAETLTKTLAKNPKSATEPRELVKSFITSTTVELNKALAKASTIKLNTEAERKAFDVCKEVMDNAKEELQSSVDNVETIVPGKPETDGDLNSWLSAVMAYQETCIDGFPEGPLKNQFRTTLNSSEVSTSNSLAMVGAGLTNVTNPQQQKPAPSNPQQQKPAPKRHLLQTRFLFLAENGLPNRMNHEERGLLKDEEDNLPPPTITVAQDGTGKFITINEALAAMTPKYPGRYVIFVKKGTYAETVTVAKRMVNLTVYVASAPGFMARSIGFRNTAGPVEHQAVEARISADKAIFLNCHFEGFQDTLYAHSHRQFYRSCVITGTVDFTFGDAAAVFQNCMIYVRKPNANQKNIITAQGRKDKLETAGIVLQNCDFALDTLFCGEFKNTGPGAITKGRMKWTGRRDINKEEAMKYTVEAFLQGAWVKEVDANARMGLGI
ncbi:hypothetical protein F3Y22_tig00110557pilonHSYRG00276 [Hibiscus syriacus]|uniref:Pectinesterase inhibitor domain-containing protein n=1 Tax=Hibiscus syriacus TaxID=106335 RepID=A0A6A3A8Y9_HIBSY|nr:hypothetical protein F3Y22_tig00110557pilonHSYRG00276 [Hibiscus syriacus]